MMTASVLKYLQLSFYRAYVDLRVEASQSHLGVIWWILEPLVYLAAFYVIFEVFLQRGGEGFVGFLLCGLVFWRWFDSGVKKLSMSIYSAAGLISQVHVPKLVFPLVDFLSVTFRFLFVFIIFLVFAYFYAGELKAEWFILPLLLLVQGVLIFGVGGVLAALTPLIPDIKKVIDNLLMVMFYMSGIFFDITRLSPEHQQYLLMNPMAVLLQSYRAVIFDVGSVDWLRLMLVAGAGVLLSLLSLWLLLKLDRYYPRVLSR